MNQLASERRLKPGTPVLYVAPANDYPALSKAKQTMFDALPRTAHTRLYAPSSNHVRAPSAAKEEIARWIAEVAGR